MMMKPATRRLLRPTRNHFRSGRRLHSEAVLFSYTSGRFLYNERLRLSERYVPFNIDALKQAISRSTDRKDAKVVSLSKWSEGKLGRLLLARLDDGAEAVVKIPYRSSAPRKLTTESEVATLELLQSYGIPVPQVYSWGSDCDNEVGCAYIVMPKVKGTHLSDIWHRLTKDTLVSLVQSYVDIEAKLFELPLNAYGSIYFRDGIVPDPIQTDLFAPGSNIRGVTTNKFCAGPLTDHSFWRGKRVGMDIDRGPWTYPAPYLHSLGYKEREFTQKYGRPIVNSFPYTDILRGTISPDSYVELLDKYLTLTPHLLPTSLEHRESRPMLRHPRLRPENIYLGEDGQISCLTGWHNTCILPSLLVCGNPRIFCNPDPLPQTNLEEPGLSSNYASLPEDEKQAAYTQWRDRSLFFNYAVHTALLCELQSEVMTTPFQPLIYHLTQTAGRPWTGDIVTLKGALMRIAQDWDNIIIRRNATKEGLPPRPFEEDKVDTQELYDMEARWWDCDHLVEDVWRKQIGIDEDGWVEASRYDEAVKVNERLKNEWIKHHLDHDVSEGKTQGYWPFDDHEEPG